MDAVSLDAVKQERISGVIERWSEFLLREIFEDDVDQMDIEALDEASAFCGDLLARKVAEALLEHRGSSLEEAVCPDCRTHCAVKTKDRTLLLRRGDVGWSEPKSRCPRCQRDFFPSAGCIED